MAPLAVIDLGTNTFHLLIVDPVAGGGFRERLRLRKFVKLAEEGIGYIGPAPFRRALDTLKEFRQLLDEYGVREVRAFGTAALRTASNGEALVAQGREATGIPILLISGDEEARLIHQGVALAVPLHARPDLIMDIGGGSVEFIIANRKQVLWTQSFSLGVAVLTQRFHQSDPIAPKEVQHLQAFLKEELGPLYEALKRFPCHRLIGSSGTFDVLENILADPRTHTLYATIPVRRFFPLHKKVLKSTLQERLEMENIPPSRAGMMVAAFVLLEYLLDISAVHTILISSYAMKEGMLDRMLTAEAS